MHNKSPHEPKSFYALLHMQQIVIMSLFLRTVGKGLRLGASGKVNCVDVGT
jgi:hypothetical protein